MFAAAHADADAFSQCWSDLIIIALFFCLRSCEYTKTNSHHRTTQFRFRDIQFHDDDGVIPTQAPAKVFMAATAVTLYLDTQKGVCGRSRRRRRLQPMLVGPHYHCSFILPAFV